MAVRIRLARVGATKRPSYRVVAIDSRRPRDGRALEILGFYDPLTDPATVQLDADRIQAWIGNGALPSDTVVKLLRQAGLDSRGQAAAEKPAKTTRAKRPTEKTTEKASEKTGEKAGTGAGSEGEA